MAGGLGHEGRSDLPRREVPTHCNTPCWVRNHCRPECMKTGRSYYVDTFVDGWEVLLEVPGLPLTVSWDLLISFPGCSISSIWSSLWQKALEPCLWAFPLTWQLPLTRLLQSKPVTKKRERLRQRERRREREPHIFYHRTSQSLTINSALFCQLDART